MNPCRLPDSEIAPFSLILAGNEGGKEACLDVGQGAMSLEAGDRDSSHTRPV